MLRDLRFRPSWQVFWALKRMWHYWRQNCLTSSSSNNCRRSVHANEWEVLQTQHDKSFVEIHKFIFTGENWKSGVMQMWITCLNHSIRSRNKTRSFTQNMLQNMYDGPRWPWANGWKIRTFMCQCIQQIMDWHKKINMWIWSYITINKPPGEW